jgi:hypothetical protein
MYWGPAGASVAVAFILGISPLPAVRLDGGNMLLLVYGRVVAPSMTAQN